MSELWDVFGKNCGENWPCYNGTHCTVVHILSKEPPELYKWSVQKSYDSDNEPGVDIVRLDTNCDVVNKSDRH